VSDAFDDFVNTAMQAKARLGAAKRAALGSLATILLIEIWALYYGEDATVQTIIGASVLVVLGLYLHRRQKILNAVKKEIDFLYDSGRAQSLAIGQRKQIQDLCSQLTKNSNLN